MRSVSSLTGEMCVTSGSGMSITTWSGALQCEVECIPIPPALELTKEFLVEDREQVSQVSVWSLGAQRKGCQGLTSWKLVIKASSPL